MEIWLKGSSIKIRFPVLPSSYQVTSEYGNETVDVNALGEIDLGGKRKLKTVSFSSLFPMREASYTQFSNIKRPKKYVEMIEQLQEEKPVLIITGTSIRMSCHIDSFSWREQDGTGDIYFDISVKEHRSVPVTASAVVTLSAADGAGTTVDGNGVARAQPETSASTYTVKKGDFLSSIARRLTGSANWKKIYEANKAVIGSNPNLIYPGQVLNIPK